MAWTRPGWSVGPKMTSYTDASFWYTPVTKSVSTTVTDSARVAASDPMTSSRSAERGGSNKAIKSPQQTLRVIEQVHEPIVIPYNQALCPARTNPSVAGLYTYSRANIHRSI